MAKFAEGTDVPVERTVAEVAIPEIDRAYREKTPLAAGWLALPSPAAEKGGGRG